MHSQEPEIQSKEQNDWDQEDAQDITMETYQHVPIDYHKLTPEERKRRTRRTRAFILIAILIMAALALGTALVIHYIFIPTENKTHINPIGPNITFNHVNKTDSSQASGTDEIGSLLNVLENHVKGATPRDHDHVINPHGRIFPETFDITTASAIKTLFSNTTVKSTAIKTKIQTSTSRVRKISTLHPTATDTLTTTQPIPTPTKDLFDFFAHDMTTAYPFESDNLTDSSSTSSTVVNGALVTDVMKTVPKTNVVITSTPQTTRVSSRVSSRVTTPVGGSKSGLSTTISPALRSLLTQTAAALSTTSQQLSAHASTTTTSLNNQTTIVQTTSRTIPTTEGWDYITDTDEPLMTTSKLLRVSASMHRPTTNQRTESTIPQTSPKSVTLKPTGSSSTLPTTTKAVALPSTSQPLPAQKSILTTALNPNSTFDQTTYGNASSTTFSERWSSHKDTDASLVTTSKPLLVSSSTASLTSNHTTDSTITQTTPKGIMTKPPAASSLIVPTTTIASKEQANLSLTTEPATSKDTTSFPVTSLASQNQTEGLVLSTQATILTESNITATTISPSQAVEKTKSVQGIVTGVTTESNKERLVSSTVLPDNYRQTTMVPESNIEATKDLPAQVHKTTDLAQSIVPDVTTESDKERLVSTTVLPDNYNSIIMDDVTTYTFETSVIHCQVKHAINWTSLTIQAKAEFRPLKLTINASGHITWSQQTLRNDVAYDIINRGNGMGDDVTLSLILKDTQCTDGNTFMCYLKSPLKDDQADSRMVVVGKPDGQVKLTLGPAVVEDRALRITASWQGGYPVPWTNMSWNAIDKDNNTYDLSAYGQYTDYELTKDDRKCQTFMQHSIVIFPRLHLNATTVIVRPNLSMKKYFVDKEMEDYLATVKPGVDRILVIPLSYCPSNAKDISIPHPYKPCVKFVRCLPGDLAVQLCPTGTCFLRANRRVCVNSPIKNGFNFTE